MFGLRYTINSLFSMLVTTLLSSSVLADLVTYPGPAGTPGSTAIAHNDPRFVGWATSVESLIRGPIDINNPTGPVASFGTASNALGPAGTNTAAVVSLGDGGSITLGFATGIRNGAGADFAVFENAFSDTFLELGFVEVSSNGLDFFRFASHSQTPTTTQVGGFGNLDPTLINNLAGKYRVGFGTPFDLQELVGISPLLDVNNVSHVRIIDVVGRISLAPNNPSWLPSRDSFDNIINDPYSTPFVSSGFDLDAIGVIHAVPEPSSFLLFVAGSLGFSTFRRERKLWPHSISLGA